MRALWHALSARRGRWLLAGGTTAALVVIGVVTSCSGPSGPDRSDPTAVATALARGQAAGTGQVCALTTEPLTGQLADEHHCTPTRQTAPGPQVRVLDARPCGPRAVVALELDPPGQLGQRYATVGLSRLPEGWAATSLLALPDPTATALGPCRHGR